MFAHVGTGGYPMSDDDFDRRVGEVRRFNRFWTRQIGVLREGYLESPFSLTEVRVFYELAHREETTAGELGEELGLDAGYLSRILSGFRKHGLIRKRPSEADGRRRLLRLTERGRGAFAPLEARSRSEIGAMLGGMSIAGQERLVEAMRAIERLLSFRPDPVIPYLLRPPSQAIWAGLSTATASYMPGSTAGMSGSRPSWRGSWRSSSRSTSREWNVVGSPREMARSSVVCS